MQLTPQLAISCLLQSRFWYASSCLSTSFLNAFATDPPTCNKLPLAKSLLVCQFLFPVLLCWTQWSFQLFCASWTKVLFGTLLTEHPFSISHAFRTMCSLSLNRMSIAKVLSKRDFNPPKKLISRATIVVGGRRVSKNLMTFTPGTPFI